ncbi:glycosyltransferase family 4 protein [Blastococcus sp. SYSU D00813]
MRIAVVHSFYTSRQPSGENAVVPAQVAALRAAGHDVELFARHTDVESQKPLYNARSAVRTASGYGGSPLREVEAFEPDVVHVHNVFPNLPVHWLGQVSAPIVVTLHNYRTFCSAATLFRDGADCTLCLDGNTVHAVRFACYRGSKIATLPLAFATRLGGPYRRLVDDAAAVVTLNREAEALLQKMAPGRTRRIPNFVGEDFAHATSGRRSGFAYVGRLTADKGILELLADWPRDRRLHIAGAGPLGGSVATAAEQEPDTFTYHGLIGRSEVSSLVSAVEGLVLPSLWREGIPTICIEALASGTPLIVSEKCSALHDLTDGGAGIPFLLGQRDSLDRALTDVSQTLASTSAAARALYFREFSPQVWVSRITSVYRQVSGVVGR